MYERERLKNIQYPSKNHERFIHFIAQQCSQRTISGLLKGSLAKGTAKEFSDVDLILTGISSADDFDAISGSFDKILLSEKMVTETFMVIYSCGLAVEYDIRESVTEEDISKSVPFGVGEFLITKISRDRIHLDSRNCPRREMQYSNVMIAQMCCAKILCQKYELSREIYCDRMELLHGIEKLPLDFRKKVYSESPQQFIERLKKQVFSSGIVYETEKKYFNNLFRNIGYW